MHKIGSIPDSLQDRWSELVGCAHDDVETLVDLFMERVAKLKEYREGAVPMERVRQDAFSSFRYLIRQIAGEDEFSAEVIWPARRLGQDRARIGIPLNYVLAAVRIDFQVLWSTFRSNARPADRELLVAGVEKIWAAVERYADEVQTGYLEESFQMADKRLSERARLMTAILNSEVPTVEDLDNLGRALEVDPDGNFVVAATVTQRDHELRKIASRLTASGYSTHIHSTGPYSLLISNWKGEDLQPLRKLLSESTCGVGPLIHGLSGLARACRLAIEIVEMRPSGTRGPMELKDMWMPFLAARLRDAAPELVASVLTGLNGVSEAEQQRMTEVALTFGRSGSITKTASQIYCHRNTALNRLKRLEELTGHDMTVPAEAALVLLSFLTVQSEPQAEPDTAAVMAGYSARLNPSLNMKTDSAI
jgi:hypothetical protein